MLFEDPSEHEDRSSQIGQVLDLFQAYYWYQKNMNFNDLSFLLETGMNAFLYGIGSKREYVNEFWAHELEDSPWLLVNGYHSNWSVRHVTNDLVEFLNKRSVRLGHKSVKRPDIDDDINEQVENKFSHLYEGKVSY